jgi:hypothetical protein
MSAGAQPVGGRLGAGGPVPRGHVLGQSPDVAHSDLAGRTCADLQGFRFSRGLWVRLFWTHAAVV